MLVCAVMGLEAHAFQIGPLGPKLEARLTNETEATLARASRRLGVLLKWPVHEEITQIGFDCPVGLSKILDDDSCAGSDAGFAHPFIMHGVRWNDVPPFRLNPGQGAKCKKYGFMNAPACNVEQTVRFSTQPDCWLCLFFEAQKVAETNIITGCQVGSQYVQGSLMTRSHFGDLQFLHAMANAEGIPAPETRRKILDWIEFAWRVFDGEIGPETKLKSIKIPTLTEHFGCSDWSVSDVFVLGRKDTLIRRLPDIAFGSVLHTVQDSFADGHVTRAAAPLVDSCPGASTMSKPGPVVEFHAYGQQDGHKHDERDSREAMASAASDVSGAIATTKELFRLWNENAPWARAKPLLECIFDLAEDHRPSSAGGPFRKRANR